MNTILKIDFDTYNTICDLLLADELTVAEIATATGTNIDTVLWVFQGEND